jgi:modification methylase
MSTIKSGTVHLTMTSPPYVTTTFKRGQVFDYEGFVRHFLVVCQEIFRVTVPGGRFALNVGDIVSKYRHRELKALTRLPLGPDLLQVAYASGFILLERFIWDKGFTRNMRGPLLGSYPYPMTIFSNNYFEYIYVFMKPGRRRVAQETREKSRFSLEEWRKWSQQWWRIESISEKFKSHGAIFPLEIPRRIIRMFSYVGDTVLDPYCGTGATLIAASDLGRRSIGFDINKSTRELVRKRLAFEKSRGDSLDKVIINVRK